MVKNKLPAFISVLFASLLILCVNATVKSAPPLTLNTQYNPHGSAGSAFTTQGTAAFPLSPANTVSQYNNANALYLITCPHNPSAEALVNPVYLFASNPNLDYGDWLAAGNTCQLPGGVEQYPVTLVLTANSLPPIVNGMPSATTQPTASLQLENAVQLIISNIGYTPEVTTSNGNVVSTAFNTKTNIFQNIPVGGQQGLWTWYGLAVDANKLNAIYQNSPEYPLHVTVTSTGNTYTYTNTNVLCSYTYSVISTIQLDNIGSSKMPYPSTLPVPSASSPQTDLVPYLIYDSGVTNPEPSNQFNMQISYDIYSPQNYHNALSGAIEPFPINSMPLFFSATLPESTYMSVHHNSMADIFGGNFVYYTSSGVSFGSATANQVYGLKYPYASAATSSSSAGGGGGGAGGCPNQDYQGNAGAQLTLVQVEDCAAAAGMSGDELVTFVSVAYAESGFHPGITETGLIAGSPPVCGGAGATTPGVPPSCAAVGILQIGSYKDSYQPSESTNYNPTTCSTYGQGSEWAGVFYNPLCAFTWSQVAYESYGYGAWGGGGGAYPSDNYCAYAPTWYSSPNCAQGGNQIPAALGSWPSSASGLPSGGGSSGGGGQLIALAQQEYTAPYCESNPQEPIGQPDACAGGSATSGGFDCSGFVQWIYGQVGILLPRTTTQQWADVGSGAGQLTQIAQSATVPGDLVYFSVPGDGTSEPAHVMMCYNSGCTDVIGETGPTGSPGVSDVPIGAVLCSAPGAKADYCIMGFMHVNGAPTSSSSPSSSSQVQQDNVFTTELAVNSVTAIPQQGYVFALATTPAGNQAQQQQSLGCVAPTASLPAPAEATVTGGGTAYYTETITASGSSGIPTAPYTYDWYTGVWTSGSGNNNPAPPLGGANSCQQYASCPSATNCNPVASYTTSSLSNTVGITIGNNQASCDVWVYVQADCQTPSSYSGNARFDSEVSASSSTTSPNPSSSSSSGTPPPALASGNTIQLYIMKVVPRGQFNASEYQPNTVLQATDSGTFKQNWNTYWNNLLNLQSANVYVVESIPFMADSQLAKINFQPENLTSDQYGDVFITGYSPDAISIPFFGTRNKNYLVEISNTIGPGPLQITVDSLCPGTFPNLNIPSNPLGIGICVNPWPEITVSPNGAQVYLANPDSGIIPIFNGANLQYEFPLNLSFSTDNSILSGPDGIAQSPLGPVAINVIDYFQSGGLYGINPNCGPANSYQGPNWVALGGPEPCDPAQQSLKNVLSAYYYNLPSVSDSGNCNWFCTGDAVDILDKASFTPFTNSNLNTNFHHPESIQDVNGYLYVLDDWSGQTGKYCGLGAMTSPLQPPNCLASSSAGVYFNLLMLRAINSSGVDVPINPTYTNDLWYYALSNGANAHLVTSKLTQPSGLLYPPYGWIIDANLTFTCDPGFTDIGGCYTKSYQTFSLCGGTPQLKASPPFNPTSDAIQKFSGCFRVPGSPGQPAVQSKDQASYINIDNGTALPIGPPINVTECWVNAVGLHTACGDEPLFGVTMAASFNNTVAIFIPDKATITQLYNLNNWDHGETANLQVDELMFATFGTQNYTKSVGGTDNLPFYYKCYYDPGIVNKHQPNQMLGGMCSQDPYISNIISPIYPLSNPFEYDSNIGAMQALTLQEELSSTLNPGSPENPAPITGISNPTLVSAYNAQAGATGTASSQFPVTPTTLTSQIEGYLIMPYTWQYTDSWHVTNVQGATATCPDPFTTLESQQTNTYTIYNYTTSLDTASNAQSANVESGSTYAESAINSSTYYEPQLAGTEAPQELFYNLLTNRQFGDIYINATFSPTTNQQGVVNSISLFTYTENTFSQGAGGLPAYAVISENQKNPPCNSPLCSSTKPGDAQLTRPVIYPINSLFTTPANNGPHLLVTLFDWYKQPVYDSGVFLTLNGSTPSTATIDGVPIDNYVPSGYTINTYGYHRIIYAYNDRFNNTIYMPLDVDIANITKLNLTVTPTVNSVNANQTSIQVNGTAYWIPPFSTNTIPLANGYIYLYFDANLNTIGYNALDGISHPLDTYHATLCAFANSMQSNICDFANPVYNGLQYNAIAGQYADGSYYITPNIITYATAYNSPFVNQCSPPPNSLLYPANQLYTVCNIYGSQSVPAGTSYPDPTLSPFCPVSAAGNTQYCSPLYYNGTGICTPQLGLFDIVQTESNGYFGANVVACGYGFHNIIAQYYGTPGPEPIYAVQSPISEAYNPSVLDTNPASDPASPAVIFTPFNYSWTPIQTSDTVPIGTVLLNFGGLSAPVILLVIIVLLCIGIAAAMLRSGKKERKEAEAARRTDRRKSR